MQHFQLSHFPSLIDQKAAAQGVFHSSPPTSPAHVGKDEKT